MNINYRSKLAQHSAMTIAFSFIALLQSCKQSPTDFATKWTKDIKSKIIEDASQQPDRTFVDSIHHEVTLFKNNKKLKQYYFAARGDDQHENSKSVIYDTAMIVFFSTDQNFQLVKQPLIAKADRSYEGVAYKGDRFGQAEYNYRKDNIKEIGFHFKNLNVGTWIKYDSTGKQDGEKVGNGNDEKLEILKDMKYYR